MHDINYFHEHELKGHDFSGCCKDCRTSLNIIKPHILAFAERIRKYTRKMLEALSPDELYRLYQILDDLAHLDAGEHLAGLILEEEEISSVLPVIWSYYSTFFSIHEEHLAKQLLGSDNPWETLKTFPLYARYEALVKSQMEAMPVAADSAKVATTAGPGSRLVFIGCGPVPMSLILMNRFHGTKSVGLEGSVESVELARRVIQALSLERGIEIVHGDDTSLQDLDWDVVLVAALAEPKARIFRNLRKIIREQRPAPVIYRTYTGMRAVLYEPVKSADIEGFKIVKRIFPTGRVNNTTVFAELED